MKTRLQKLLIAIAGLLVSANAFAYDFYDDGICYNIISSKDRTVEVTYKDKEGDDHNYYTKYVGDISIPPKVIDNGITYSVTSIDDYAFSRCSGLTSVTIPNSVTSIGSGAFYDCTGLTDVNITDISAWCKINFYLSDSNPLYNGAVLKLNGTIVTDDLVIPNSVTRIGDYVFAGYDRLTSVTIPNSVTSIGDYAFYYCKGLTSVTIPNSVTSIGDYAFQVCTGLTSVTIGNSITSIGDYAFNHCKGLTSVTIPNSVTSIGDSAFSDCTGLTSVTIPNSVTSIGDYAFSDCTGLTSVTIPNSATSIGNYAFQVCTGLTSVTIGNSITSIGNYAFYYCKGLTSVTIPNSVTSIGDSAFSDCTGLTSVTIPNSVTSIGDHAFNHCKGLTSVTIPNSVTSIGERAFYDCTGMESVTIQNELIEIGKQAFSCKGSIYCRPKTPPTKCDISAFTDDALMYSTLYVPLGTKKAYESVDPWRNFWNIVEMDFSDVDEIAIDESADLSISVNGGEIVVNNADNCTISIYSLAGQLVYSNNAYNNESIALSKGVYIVKAGGKTQKVII